MIVGVLREIKSEENRVAMTPSGAEVLVMNGHTVLIEKGAGKGSGFRNDDYVKVGAEIVNTAGEIYTRAEMIMHVKEPLQKEYKLIREDQIVFT